MKFTTTEITLKTSLFATLINHVPTHVASVLVDFATISARIPTMKEIYYAHGMGQSPISFAWK